LDTDLQLGYEIYDKSYEINAIIQATDVAASRSNVIQSDADTRAAVNGLNLIASQLRSSPRLFFSELAYAAASRTNNEAWHFNRLRTNYASLQTSLKVLLNETGVVQNLARVLSPEVVEAFHTSLEVIRKESTIVLESAERISRDVSSIRANSSLLLTPQLIGDFIDSSASKEIVSSLTSIRRHLAVLLLSVRDAGRLTTAHGSVHELLTRSATRDTTTRTTALNSFVNSYNLVRNNLIRDIESYRQAAETGIYNFITRVQSTYRDDIVRPKFDREQVQLITSFGKEISSRVYNTTFFASSFDSMRDKIFQTYTNAANSSLSRGSGYVDAILDLQRTSFSRRYPRCLDDLVTEAQQNSYSLTSKYTFCLNERTSGITVVIPGANSWLSVIRGNINSILSQLGSCLTGQTTVAARTATSDCIQFVSICKQSIAFFRCL
jgi:hypothetical protein